MCFWVSRVVFFVYFVVFIHKVQNSTSVSEIQYVIFFYLYGNITWFSPFFFMRVKCILTCLSYQLALPTFTHSVEIFFCTLQNAVYSSSFIINNVHFVKLIDQGKGISKRMVNWRMLNCLVFYFHTLDFYFFFLWYFILHQPV